MERILHPVSGESGYFASEKEKSMIDIAVLFMANQSEKLPCSPQECGEANE